MGLGNIWKNYRVLIIMGTGLGLVHWGWHKMKSNPIFHPDKDDFVPEPAIVTYVLKKDAKDKTK